MPNCGVRNISMGRSTFDLISQLYIDPVPLARYAAYRICGFIGLNWSFGMVSHTYYCRQKWRKWWQPEWYLLDDLHQDTWEDRLVHRWIELYWFVTGWKYQQQSKTLPNCMRERRQGMIQSLKLRLAIIRIPTDEQRTFEAVPTFLWRCRMNPCAFTWSGYIENFDGIFKTTIQPGEGFNARLSLQLHITKLLLRSQIKRQTVWCNLSFDMINDRIWCSQLRY